MSYIPDPTGIWEEALHHLAQAELLMTSMTFPDPHRDFTVADAHQLSFGSMRTTITEHWRHAWWMQASRPAATILVLDPPLGVDQAHGHQPEQQQERQEPEREHGGQPGSGPG